MAFKQVLDPSEAGFLFVVRRCGKVLNMVIMPFVSPFVFHFSLRSTALCAETANPD